MAENIITTLTEHVAKLIGAEGSPTVVIESNTHPLFNGVGWNQSAVTNRTFRIPEETNDRRDEYADSYVHRKHIVRVTFPGNDLAVAEPALLRLFRAGPRLNLPDLIQYAADATCNVREPDQFQPTPAVELRFEVQTDESGASLFTGEGPTRAGDAQAAEFAQGAN